MDAMNVVTAPKTATFQMRINPEIKRRVEELYAQQGLSLTDAVNLFLQQSLNAEGLPFLASAENGAYLREKAFRRLMREIDAGAESAERGGWVEEDEARRLLGEDL